MSFLAKLVLGSAEYNVLAADYEISQSTDAQNRPNGKPKGGIISLTLEASNKNDLAEWMLSPTMKKAGQLTFFRRDANSSMKTISFSDAFCINYRETFDANSKDPMKTLVRISAGELKINNTAVTNPWSAMAARVQDIGDKLGLGSIMGGGDNGGGMMGDIMGNDTVQSMGSYAKQAYDTGKQGYDEGKKAYNTAEQTKKEADAVQNDAEEKIASAKQVENDAEDKISSFIP